ncbi:TetR/AcrR family transcriptional regulator [Microbacterium oleivorans]|uniref:TetR/AcrR family transcriptional regulator n=1 Tax=Microbacterium oleivorans TaxID=273677 RepID=UPI00203B60D7|nr:TetR/AcrR family transcriptional regulator [Microbacterium oleivorans]MCM3697016.1 TetR/AcrR family transcriptional regulator [Microbacterium oleivorans]
MGRTATFDRGDVVRAARDVFWSRGYAETGIGELEEATGLNRSSLYHAFGSKKGLFEAVVAAYLEEVVRRRLAPLQRSDAAATALADYVAEMREAIAGGSPRARSGCLLINAACGPLVDDEPELRAIVTRYADELREGVARGVAAARPGLSEAARAPLAEAVASLVIAALAIARTDPDAAVRSLDAVAPLVAGWRA